MCGILSAARGARPREVLFPARQGNAFPQEDLDAAGSAKWLLVMTMWGFRNLGLAQL